MQKLIYPYRWLAYTSALVTMFSFGFGTFTQQLIAYVDLPVTSGILQPKCVDRAEIVPTLTESILVAGKQSQYLLLNRY